MGMSTASIFVTINAAVWLLLFLACLGGRWRLRRHYQCSQAYRQWDAGGLR